MKSDTRNGLISDVNHILQFKYNILLDKDQVATVIDLITFYTEPGFILRCPVCMCRKESTAGMDNPVDNSENVSREVSEKHEPKKCCNIPDVKQHIAQAVPSELMHENNPHFSGGCCGL